ITNTTFYVLVPNHRLVSHIPVGPLNWQFPISAEEIPLGISPSHPHLFPHEVWRVNSSSATILVNADADLYVAIKPFGKGYFIYYAGMQLLTGHGGWAPSHYSYLFLRKAIEWAFESVHLPVPRLSPWPYAYDAAF